MKKQILPLLLLVFILLISSVLALNIDKGINTHNEDLNSTARLVAANDATLEQMIINYSIENGINYETALRIANCESKMGKYKYNLQGSSAKGIFQFIDNTWENYCDGDVLNDEDNVRCFMKLYEEHKSWWSCS